MEITALHIVQLRFAKNASVLTYRGQWDPSTTYTHARSSHCMLSTYCICTCPLLLSKAEKVKLNFVNCVRKRKRTRYVWVCTYLLQTRCVDMQLCEGDWPSGCTMGTAILGHSVPGMLRICAHSPGCSWGLQNGCFKTEWSHVACGQEIVSVIPNPRFLRAYIIFSEFFAVISEVGPIERLLLHWLWYPALSSRRSTCG